MITQSVINEIRNILYKHLSPKDYKIFIFGSHATGKNIKTSDIDLGIEGKPLKGSTIVKIQEEFENSNITQKIDVVDFNNVSDNFKKIAKSKTIYL